MSASLRALGPRGSDRWWSLASPGYDYTVGLVGWHRWQDALVSDVASGIVLDVGCGPAHLAQGLLRRGIDYVGVDRSHTMLAHAAHAVRGCGPGRAHLLRADLTALPFTDACFDLVVSTGVLGLLDRPARNTALTEIARVTKGEVRLLEPIVRGDQNVDRWRWRLLAFVSDQPLELAELQDVGLAPRVVGDSRFAGTYSFVLATKK